MSARRDSDAPVTLSDPLASLRRGGTIRLKLLKIGALAGSFAGSFGAFTVSGVPIDRDAFVSETSRANMAAALQIRPSRGTLK